MANIMEDFMKKMVLLMVLGFSAVPIFSFSVSSDELTSKYGVSYSERQKSNYIEKGGYSFRYLGHGTWDVKSLSSSSSRYSGGPDGQTVLIIVIVSIIHIILTYCVYKKKDGTWACFYFFLAPLAIAGILLYFYAKSGAGGSGDRNHITITHRNV